MAVDKKIFADTTKLVIDNLEGGYYHPNMLIDGRVKDSRYSNSGETMFGIDRKQGGTINTSSSGVKFWNLIDSNNAKDTWKWNYKGGSIGDKLKELAVEMMLPLYSSLAKTYLSAEALKIVESNRGLLFHFVYAAWNGSGWFKKFATDINQAVASGIKSPDKLMLIAVNSRTSEGLKPGSSANSLIKQGGEKIKQLFGSAMETVKKKQFKIGAAILFLGLLTTGIIIYNRK